MPRYSHSICLHTFPSHDSNFEHEKQTSTDWLTVLLGKISIPSTKLGSTFFFLQISGTHTMSGKMPVSPHWRQVHSAERAAEP